MQLRSMVLRLPSRHVGILLNNANNLSITPYHPPLWGCRQLEFLSLKDNLFQAELKFAKWFLKSLIHNHSP